MTTSAAATEKKTSGVNPDPSEQGIDFSKECHYTLDIFICTHKIYRRPRVTHVGSCRYPAGTHTKTQCNNFAKSPLVVYVPELCTKCMPKTLGIRSGSNETQSEQGEDPGSTRGAESLVDIGKKAKEKTHNEEHDDDANCDHENDEVGSDAWTRIEEDIPSLENGAAPAKKSIFGRIFGSFTSSPRATNETADGMKEAEADVEAGWVEVEQDPDWEVVRKNEAK